MANNVSHTTEYRTLGKVLLFLMLCTFLTITVTGIHLGPLSVTVALVIACAKAYTVMTYFMHLKYESLLLKLLVGFVFVLFVLIILITFIDYAFR
jgi:cytochrome c oxidase subunit IV